MLDYTAHYDNIPLASPTRMTFAKKILEIRKERRMTQEEIATQIGTCKQVISRYENCDRVPCASVVQRYANKLDVSVAYLMGAEDDELAYSSLFKQNNKPFHRIFQEITTDMMLTVSDVMQLTGLTESQIHSIIANRMETAPLPIALQLSKTLGVSLNVWAGDSNYEPSDISIPAYQVAKAYDLACQKKRTAILSIIEL